MKTRYIIPASLLVGYLIYKKFYAIDFKDIDFDYSQEEIPHEIERSPLFSPPDTLRKGLDDIDWGEVTG